MKHCISQSIIMRIKELGESDLLVTFFTEDKGRLKGVAKGAKRSRQRFPNCLDLFCLTNMEYEERKTKPLSFLHSCRLIDAFVGIRQDFSTLALASYMVELTEILFPLSVADKKMFKLLKNSLSALHNGQQNDLVRILFEIQAMAIGGYTINLSKCHVCGRTYQGKGKAIFLRSEGGIACLKCKRETSVAPALEPADIKWLTKIYSSEPSALNENKILPAEQKIMSTIKRVSKLHIEYHLAQKLKTGKYLD